MPHSRTASSCGWCIRTPYLRKRESRILNVSLQVSPPLARSTAHVAKIPGAAAHRRCAVRLFRRRPVLCPRLADVVHYVDSEVGRLGTVMLHRPGPELARLTPRNNDSLLFDGIPWIGRAQDEHDAFAQALRDHDVEVLYLVELLTQALEVPEARREIIESTT